MTWDSSFMTGEGLVEAVCGSPVMFDSNSTPSTGTTSSSTQYLLRRVFLGMMNTKH